MNLSNYKQLVERSPRIAATYRALREILAPSILEYKSTSMGFQIAGHPSMQDGTFEPAESAFVMETLRTTDVFIDVGANIGFYTCLARSRGVKTVAVEPHPANLNLLYANLMQNGWRDVEVFPVGLGSAPEVTELYGQGVGASLVRGWAGVSPNFRQVIPLLTLDLVAGERFKGQRVLVKVDVEGGEKDVLLGGMRTLQNPGTTWLVEICLTEHYPNGLNPHFESVFELFFTSGYVAWTLDEPRRRIERADVKRWIAQRARDFGSYNVVFARDT